MADTKAAVKSPTAKAATPSPVKAAKSAVAKPVVAKAPAPKSAVAKVKATPTVAPAKSKAPPAKPTTAATKSKATAKPATAAKPKVAPKVVIPDNLELLKGVGPKLNTLLKTLGVTSFEQVANWAAADIADIDAKLGTFAGRISRDNWIDQSKLLVAGDVAGFEKKYGSLGSEIAKS